MNHRFWCQSLTMVMAMSTSCAGIALPKDPAVIAGTAGMQEGLHGELLINTSESAIVNWGQFSIDQGERVQFIQPTSTSAVLNRVTGKEMSQLLGQLHANGKVYLINPSGIIFGSDSVIKTAEFLASTHDLSDAQFLDGKEWFFSGDSKEAIINYGRIFALDGSITLLAKIVENGGSLEADRVNIAAGQEILLQLDETPLLTIRPSILADSKITLNGAIQALIVDLQSEGLAAAHGINVQGSILALNTVEQGGRIYLKSEGIAVAPSAKLEAPGGIIAIEPGSKDLYLEGQLIASEGHISVEGNRSNLWNLGTLDVSGGKGGHISIDAERLTHCGQILANGEKSDGGSIVIHVQESHVETGQARISANGIEQAGKIELVSEKSYFSSGTLSAQGLNGGEISILSPILTLVSAEVNASGNMEGGQIFIGGDAYGQLRNGPNAKMTRVGGDTLISASAKDAGNGGKIVIWGDERTVCYGSVEAKGGSSGGNGGWIEVSSKGDLCCAAALNASAPEGKPGEVLLDPKTISVSLAGVYPQYEFIDPSPGGTGFGDTVIPLSTGNVAISKPGYLTNIGAIYLYNGLTAELISSLTGNAAGDLVGSYLGNPIITVLTGNPNFVVGSPNWNGAAGAATWIDGATGLNGVVAISNSYIGTLPNNLVSSGGITALTNGHYVVSSPNWESGGPTNIGAATWGNGTTGSSGAVSGGNSFIGVTASDAISSGGVIALQLGNYVVLSPQFTGAAAQSGAASWGNGTNGQFVSTLFGAVSSANSLVGATANDNVGTDAIALSNGNYVVLSPNFNTGVVAGGAATWCNKTGVTVGTVTAMNSLIGNVANSNVGESGFALTNGNYLVISVAWDSSKGAVTWGNGSGGTVGAVSAANSLVGSAGGDQVGINGVIELAVNGNYVVSSYNWNGGRGASTWGSGISGVSGAVSIANSFIGSNSNDFVGLPHAVALTNGNYVIPTPNWQNGVHLGAGAATWGNGTTGIVGTINEFNSLIGIITGVSVGHRVTALTNGNYVVQSPFWSATTLTFNNGAVTWGNGLVGTVGPVSGNAITGNSFVGPSTLDLVGGDVFPLANGNYVVLSAFYGGSSGAVTLGNGTNGHYAAGMLPYGAVFTGNSLVGSSGDSVGAGGVLALPNSNYVVNSYGWNGNRGAVTWGDGTTGVIGNPSALNSLVGSVPGDQVGSAASVILVGGPNNGDYVVQSPSWHNGVLVAAGAVTLGSAATGIVGPVTVENSVVGSTANSGLSINHPVLSDSVNETFLVPFTTGGVAGSGQVVAGLFNPNQLTFTRAEAQVVNITPSFVTKTLNTNTAVTLQANDDIFISDPIVASGTAALTLQAGRSVVVNADITTIDSPIAITANQGGVIDADRDVGNAVLSLGSGVTINSGTGGITLTLSNGAGNTNTDSGNVTLADNVTLQSTGSGAILITATDHSITIGDTANITTVDGLLQLTAQEGISFGNNVIVQDTGTGSLTINAATADITGIDGVSLTTASGPVVVTAEGSVTLGNSGTIQSLGAGSVSVTATNQNILLGNNFLGGTTSGALELIAGENVTIGDNATLQSSASGAISVTATNGNIGIGNTLVTGTTDAPLTFTAANNITVGNNGTVQDAGNGALNFVATAGTITFGSGSLASTVDGLLQFTAGVDINAPGATIKTTGTGELILLSDNLFPTAPDFGNGGVHLSGATLTTNHTKLLIYASQKQFTTLPAQINGIPVPSSGTSCANSIIEKCATYYPSSSGIPFTVFYKQGVTPPPVPPIVFDFTRSLYKAITAMVAPFQSWNNPWYNDLYFASDRYPPFLTPKALHQRLPSLVHTNQNETDLLLAK